MSASMSFALAPTTLIASVIALGVLLFILFIFLAGWRVIPENASGLVIKKFGAALRLPAAFSPCAAKPVSGPAPSARLAFRLLALAIPDRVRADGGRPRSAKSPWWWPTMVKRSLRAASSAAVASAPLQDAAAFLEHGGERGRQLAILTAGTYRINPAAFRIVTARTAAAFGMQAVELHVRQVAADTVGIVTTLDGQAIPQGGPGRAASRGA